MTGIHSYAWIILLIIGVTAAIKIISLVVKNRNERETSTTTSERVVSARAGASASPNTNETGTMIYYANDPHNLGDKEYRFNYKRVYDSQFGKYSWRAYIVRIPSLRGRDSSLHITHRLTDGNGTYWVCWDSAVDTLNDMQIISRFWADSIQEYIATGKRFG